MKRDRHICVIGALAESLLNFRGDLLSALVAAGYRVTAMAAPASPELVTRLSKMGVNFVGFPIQRNGMNPLKDLRTLISLRSALKKIRPDVVIAYTIKPVIWGGLALTGLKDIKFCALITGLGFAFQAEAGIARRYLMLLVTSLYRTSLKRAYRVIFQNPDNRRFFIEQHIALAEKCAEIRGSGVDLEHFNRHDIPPPPAIFTVIARLLGEKGFREFADAALVVKAARPSARFIWVGPEDPSPDGIRSEELEARLLQGALEYVGPVSDVRPYLEACHIFVLPSYHEGMPRTVLEAMAIGRPILTTDVPGCRETVVVGNNGFLVPYRNSAALAEKMIWFFDNPKEWERMGNLSRRIAEDRFEVRAVTKEILKIVGL